MKNNFESLVGKLDNQMINTHIRGYETSDIPTEKKREIYKYYLEKEFPQFAEKIYSMTEANFIEIEEETEMENNYIKESYLNFVDGRWEKEGKKMAQNDEEKEMEKIYLSDLQKDYSINWTSLDENWLEDDKGGYYTMNEEAADWIRSLVEAMQLLDNLEEDYTYVSDEDIIEWAEAIKEKNVMDWKEFANLEEVQVDQSTTGTGNALFYNDENIVVSVEIDGDHDDITLWEDEDLLKELQELVKAGYDDIYSSVRPLSKLGKEVS